MTFKELSLEQEFKIKVGDSIREQIYMKISDREAIEIGDTREFDLEREVFPE